MKYSQKIQLRISLCLLGCFIGAAPYVDAAVFEQPTQWIELHAKPGVDQTDEINQAVKQIRAQGGGTVYLTAGEYRISSPLEIGTDQDPLSGELSFSLNKKTARIP